MKILIIIARQLFAVVRVAHQPMSRGSIYDSYLVFVARMELLAYVAAFWLLAVAWANLMGIL